MPAPRPSPAQIPLTEIKLGQLQELVEGLDASTLTWLAGYLYGLAAEPVHVADSTVTQLGAGSTSKSRLTILYGSQTGNARRLAEKLGRSATSSGFSARVVAADDYNVRELKSERLVYLVVSTQGEGDPPDHARGFYDFVMSKRIPRLDGLHFAVLGLGDNSYSKFCQVGRDLDARLEDLGATRVVGRGDADVDIDTIADPWLERALSETGELLKPAADLATVTPLRPGRATPTWSRANPFQAEVLLNQRITTHDAVRDIRHIELSLAGSGLVYEPGDSLGIWPENPRELVQAIISRLGLNGDESITHGDDTLALSDWLSTRRELTRLSRRVLLEHAQRARNTDLQDALNAPDATAALLTDYQLIDLLAAYPAAWSGAELVAVLRPQTPRLYSIASSMKVVDTEAHLTVARIAYDAFGRAHLGAASHQLCSSDADDRISVFIERNERFRLPGDPTRDVVMIGPGTGVAPFRGFIQERAAVGASGRNWLFFGSPHMRRDFLYQLEWQQALKRAQLQRLDVAFSRDQADKVYVQHCMRRRGRELYAWLQDGAHVYVCGDAKRMAADVHAALCEIVAEHGGKSAQQAEAYLSRLVTERRYLRDVY